MHLSLHHAPKSYRYIDLIQAAYIAVLLTSNVASSGKIVDWGIGLLGLPLAFDAGTLLFPLSYIFSDVLTEVYGFRRSRRIIWSGFGALLILCACLAAVQYMPGEAQWQGYAGDAAFAAILGGLTSGGLVVASLTAYLLGEFSNSAILSRMKVMMNGKRLWVRTIGSTLVGQLVDTGVFVTIACAFGVFPWSLATSLLLSNYIFKVSIEILFTPVTYAIVKFLKRAEQEDAYDRGVSLNPFGISA